MTKTVLLGTTNPAKSSGSRSCCAAMRFDFIPSATCILNRNRGRLGLLRGKMRS